MFEQRLRLARKRAGLSMSELAKSVTPNISAQSISKYEAGKMMPSSAVLVSLGKVLGVSLDFLLSSQVESLESIEWRKNSNVSARDRAMAEALVIEKLEHYFAIEGILDLHPAADPFADLPISEVADEKAVDTKAYAVRESWKLGIDPIPSMTALLEGKGLKVIEANLPEKINGLACHIERTESPPTEAIIVSQHTSVERKRLNLAHELAHRVITDTGSSALKKAGAMNRFASAFLIPREHLETEVGSHRHGTTWHEIMALKRTYGVSAATMLTRLGQVGLFPEAVVKYAFKTYARNWRKKEPEPIESGEGFAAFEKPRRFEFLVWRALGEKLISPVRAAQMLDRSLDIIEQEIKGPRDL